jgi:hypothetical protein
MSLKSSAEQKVFLVALNLYVDEVGMSLGILMIKFPFQLMSSISQYLFENQLDSLYK